MPSLQSTNPPLVPQQLLPQTTKAEVTYHITPQRVHELALQAWFYHRFFVLEGYPVPIVFSTPMDAYSEFQRLWAKGDENPFSYLLQAKDSKGNALYEPYPANIRYPLISVKRVGFAYRTTQSYGIHNWRRLTYPTVNNVSQGLHRKDLANVTQAGMPTGWDFKYQVEHFCSRPDTQSIFIHGLMRNLSHSGGIPQTFVPVMHPGASVPQMCRMFLTGDIDDMTEEEPTDQRVYRTSFSLTIEGYSVDIDTKTLPAMWQITIGTASKESLDAIYQDLTTETTDYRDNPAGSVLETLPHLPPA